MNDSRPFGDFAPSGFTRWVIDRTRGLPEGWAGRRVALMLRHLAMKMLKGLPLDLETFGVRMRLYPYKNVCERRILFTPQYFDADELKILTDRISPGFTFIDVGSNVGWYALFLAQEAGTAVATRILAVEPQPEIFDRLIYNIRQNPFGTIKAVDCAVADKTGELTLFLDPRNRGEASLKIVNSSQTDAIRVPAVTLLELLNREGLDPRGCDQARRGRGGGPGPRSLLPGCAAALYPALFIVANVPERWQIDVDRPAHEQGLPAGARDQDEPGLRAALTSGHRGVTISTGRSMTTSSGVMRHDIGVGFHPRREGVPEGLVVGRIDVAGDVEALRIHLDHIDEGGPRAGCHHVGELVEVLGAARRDAVRELGEARLAHEVAVLHLEIAGRLRRPSRAGSRPGCCGRISPPAGPGRSRRRARAAPRAGPRRPGALGREVLMPTSWSGPPPAATSTNSQLYSSLRLGFVARERRTRLPGSFSPSIAPGLAQWAVTISPRVELDIGQKSLVALDEAALEQGFLKTHRIQRKMQRSW